MNRETWKDIPGTEGCYQASSLGRVRSVWVLKPWRTAGYKVKNGLVQPRMIVAVRINGKIRKCYLHRLIAAAFIGPCPEGKEVNHINGDPTSNGADNLEYVTRSYNIHHAHKHGLYKRSRKRK